MTKTAVRVFVSVALISIASICLEPSRLSLWQWMLGLLSLHIACRLWD